MSKASTLHFREEYLLQYVDGELKKQEAARVQEHLEACWRCRAALADLQQTITDYVSCLDESNRLIPEPPQPWGGFQVQLNQLAGRRQASWWRRAGETIAGLFSTPRVRLASVAATILVAVLVTEFELNRPVRAAELLTRASAQELVSTAARGGILIRARNRSFTRPALLISTRSNEPQSDVPPEIRDLFQAADYSWENPLSARSFAAWHDRLPARSDNVDEVETGGLKTFRIRTSTTASTLEEATLSFRTDNYGVVSGAFRFKDNSWIEMEITSLPPADAPPVSNEAAANPVPLVTASPTVVDKVTTQQEPDEPGRKLRVFAALRDAGADLGEQIELSSGDSGRIVVSATGLPPQRRETLRQALAAIPGVDVHFIQPDTVQAQGPSGRAPGFDTAFAPSALQRQIEKAVGGGAAMERLTDQILEAGAAASARAHALQKLAENFPPSVESSLSDVDYATLKRLRTDHADALIRSSEEIRRIIEPILAGLGVQPRSLPQPAAVPATWQAATQDILDDTSRADRLLTMIVTGSEGSAQENLLTDAANAIQQLAAGSGRFRSIASDLPPGRH